MLSNSLDRLGSRIVYVPAAGSSEFDQRSLSLTVREG
jgi:hypothetical protein